MGGSKQSGTATTTSNSAPWSAQQPYLLGGFTQAANLAQGTPPQYFPGTTYAQAPLDQTDATGLIASQAHQDLGASQAYGGTDLALAEGYGVGMNPALSPLEGMVGTNLGANNAGTATLTNQANGQVYNPAVPDLSSLAGYNSGLSGPWASALQQYSQGGAIPQAAANALSNNSSYNLGTGNASTGALGGYTGLGLGGAGTLANLSGSNIAGGNPANSALANYASGASLAQGNPNTSVLAQQVEAQVLPGIQAQFIQGGALNSPEAARASAAGVTSALAPIMAQQYQQEEQNQINAGSTLGSQYLQGLGLQGSLAGQLGSLGLQGASTLGSQALQGQQNQNTAAGTLGSLGLQGQSLGQQAATSLGGLATTGAGVQANAAGTLGSQALQSSGLQQSAAGTLGNQLLQGGALQNSVAQNLGSNYGQGVQQQLSALGLAPSLQQMPYTDLSQLYSSGATQQALQQASINDQIQRWNYQQQLPYTMLNQYLGQVTGNYGGTSTLNQPILNNPSANILGGASALGGLASGIGALAAI